MPTAPDAKIRERMRAIPQPILERLARSFWSKVEMRGPDECWPWKLSLNRAGYGQVRCCGDTFLAHRIAYELTAGPIPEGRTLDHVKARGCTLRSCCNPAHLEPVTQRVNAQRGRWAERLYCAAGHLMAETRVGRGECNECRKARKRRRYAETRAMTP
jgi:hypothetical protein